jgi:tetratricopeptide (TPR) repeat protein
VTQILRLFRRVVLIDTDTRFRSIAFSCLVILGAMPVIYRGYCHFRADLLAEHEQTITGYSRAITYDADNAKLWWIRGRLRHYSLGPSDLPAAVQDYERALSLNPHLGQAWLDLADCQEHLGNLPRAEECLQKALKVWAYSPTVHWQAGNYYLLRGNLERMYEHFRAAIDYDNTRLDIALQVAWKADPEHSRVLLMLVPDKMPANLGSLAFFIAHDEMELARMSWERFLHNHFPEGFSGGISLVFPYIDALLAKNRIEEASGVWVESWDKNALHNGELLVGQKLAVNSRTDPTVNLVWNGSFENQILDGGFDWRRQETDEANVQIDEAVHVDGLRSLKVTFNNTNIDFSHLSQILPTPSAGNYWLQYYLKTQNLTTDQRPYFVIESFPRSQGIIMQTESFPSLSSWKRYSFAFKVNPDTKAVKLSLRRSPSEKFDSQIQGLLWLDDVAIRVDNLQSETAKKSIENSSEN